MKREEGMIKDEKEEKKNSPLSHLSPYSGQQ